jgi:hypothetical protein
MLVQQTWPHDNNLTSCQDLIFEMLNNSHHVVSNPMFIGVVFQLQKVIERFEILIIGYGFSFVK